MAKEEKKIKVVAEFEITSPEGKETIRTHSAAWRKAYTLPTPVLLTFLGYARLGA